MKPEVRDQLQRVIDGHFHTTLASQIIAEARKELDISHCAFLQALAPVIVAERARHPVADARHAVSAAHKAFLRDLNATLAAEAALRRRTEPIETYRAIDIYAISLGTAVIRRFKCIVKTETFISCTCEGIRSMIDEALRTKTRSPKPRPSSPSQGLGCYSQPPLNGSGKR
jgi:hypothetical protein